jgi:hypothetical protein
MPEQTIALSMQPLRRAADSPLDELESSGVFRQRLVESLDEGFAATARNDLPFSPTEASPRAARCPGVAPQFLQQPPHEVIAQPTGHRIAQ